MNLTYRLSYQVKITIPYTKVPSRWLFWKPAEDLETIWIRGEHVDLTEDDARAAAVSPRIAQALALERFSKLPARGQLYSDLSLRGPVSSDKLETVPIETAIPSGAFVVDKRITVNDLASKIDVIDSPYCSTDNKPQRYTPC